MEVEFDYPKLIGDLSLEQKRKFYVLFAHNLTVSNRGIWSDESLSNSDKVEGMKWTNELMHRLVFHIEDLHNISNLKDLNKTDEDLWQEIEHWYSQNYEIVAGNVGWAIKFSYQTVIEL
ncbi:MAG: hypothetical protein M3405_06845 [Acidobacteriota bacterium]|jgi:hypothetical protein|nr:hypothetical protein [Acidobacteriota bacterium]